MDTQAPAAGAAPIVLAPWLFWTLICLIVLLFAILLIRDKGFRNLFKKLFTWVGRRIEVAKIKSRINRNTQRKSGLFHVLGQKVWEKRIQIDGSPTDLSRIDTLVKDDKTLKEEIEKLETRMEEGRRTLEDLNRREDEETGALEEKRKPIVAEFKSADDTMKDMEKEARDLERERQRLEKKAGQTEREIEKIREDDGRSSEEKDNHIRPLQLRLKEISDTAAEMEARLVEIRSNLADQTKVCDRLKSQVDGIDEEMESLRKEHKKRQKESEKSLDLLDKDKRAQVIKRVGLEKELALLFDELGKEAYRLRLEDEELALIIIQIDDIENSIQELERKLN